MQKSDSIAALAAAMAEAQGEMENASKNSENQHFRSKYADLAEVLNTVRPVLSRHGLSITQFPSYGDGLVHVETIIAHKSGEWMSEKCSAPAQKQDPQGVGSAISYLRRYSLAAVCGIAQEDDDANASSKPKSTAKPVETKPAPQPVPDRPITDSQRKQLMSIYGKAPRDERIADANKILLAAKPDMTPLMSFSELTERMAKYLIQQLEQMRAA